ncbi:S9 family peptidase [Undibacterium terreum]|uniref:Acyl-peptide hydrolase n=1 Tax=Undibacterium terreum TaxID=1224302 RepID=A0A916XEP4_9BURK|nr:S9 family peptidase [Undibacterium terreum]GGC67995.1 peptidase S9 [Undibacterium terreum]
MESSFLFKKLTAMACAASLGILAICAGAAESGTASATAKESPKAGSKAVKRYTIEQFMATTSILGASFSADENRILYSSNETGIFNVYVIPVAGGKPEQLTKSTSESTYSVSFFPNDDRIMFTHDKGGDENNHLYVRNEDGSEKDITPGDKLKASFVSWSEDGTSFFVTTNERDPKYFDLYRYDTKSFSRELLFKNEQGFNIADISRNQRWVALGKPNTTSDNEIYLYDISNKILKNLTPHMGSINYGAQSFDPQSQRLLFTTDENGEFTALRSYDLGSGTFKDVEKADWDIVFTYYSKDGRFRVTGVNEDGSTAIRLVQGTREEAVKLPKLPKGEIRGLQFSGKGSRMAFYVNGDQSPSNLFVYDFKSKQVKQLTQSLSKEIDPADLVEAQVVRFKSFDGMVVPSIYYKPRGASASAKVPALVYVHGGPGGQTKRGYSAQIQYLVNHGYAVLGINNRGSGGYGKSFYKADDRKHGREPLWDCVEAKTYLAGLGYIDPERVGIIGGSYGGYMTLAALAFRPEAFKVGIDIFGVSNWLRTLESIPPYWESFRKALYEEIGDPVADKDFLIATSPLFHAKEIRAPLMVIQGANDPRVIKPESDEIVDAVKKNGVPVEYVVFADEGHGFSKKKNQMEANRKILEFLDAHLKGNGSGKTVALAKP